MALSVHYQLRLPITTRREQVLRTLTDLQRFATKLTFAEVSPVVDLASPGGALEMRWFATAQCHAHRATAPREQHARSGFDRDALFDVANGAPMAGHAFVILPGEGSEPATIGFVERQDDATVKRELGWGCRCTTQYAANVSEQHFFACHVNLVRVLDRARSLGVAVEVDDDGTYWQMRSEHTLLDELRRRRKIVAQCAQILDGGRTVEAAILA